MRLSRHSEERRRNERKEREREEREREKKRRERERERRRRRKVSQEGGRKEREREREREREEKRSSSWFPSSTFHIPTTTSHHLTPNDRLSQEEREREAKQRKEDMENKWSMRGLTCLVTGGSKGIGKATIEEFGALGAKVFTCARNKRDCKLSSPFLIFSHTKLSDAKRQNNFSSPKCLTACYPATMIPYQSATYS